MFPSSDRRKTARGRAFYRLDVLDKRGEPFGCMTDISAGGMRVTHITAEDLVSVARLHLELPRWMGLGRELVLKGRFVWYRETERGTEGGFAFHGPSRSAEATIERLIKVIAQAARALGMDRTALSKRIKRLGLKKRPAEE